MSIRPDRAALGSIDESLDSESAAVSASALFTSDYLENSSGWNRSSESFVAEYVSSL